MQANLQMREHASYLIQVPLRTKGREAGDTDMLEQLNLWSRKNVSMYDWVDKKVAGITSALSIEASLSDVNIVVDNFSKWLVLPLFEEKRKFNSFDDCTVSFYECMVTRILLWMPFSKFELVILKH